jgi:pentatricopeptide repeat protein
VEHHTASTAAHFINAVQSLYFTLKNQQAAMQNQRRIQNTHLSMTIDQRDHLEKSLRNTLIQTVRGLADMGDYALLLKLLLDAVIPFATHFSKTYTITYTNDTIGENVHILHPRIFGEALVGLGQRTLCSTSKLKKLWNAFTLYYSQQDLLFITPPSAVELTAMMTGLARRGKVKAALQLFYSMTRSHIEDESNETDNHHTSLIIPPDSYAICELLRILADSIQPTTLLKKLELDHSTDLDTDTDTDADTMDIHEDYDSSPCWQWRETIHILNWVEAQHPHSLSNPLLNNHVYSAALKVNEQAHLCYGMQKHKGALFALSLLDRMKVSLWIHFSF